MFSSKFMPLRTTVGDSLTVQDAVVTDRAPFLDNHDIDVRSRSGLDIAAAGGLFLPQHLRRAGSTAGHIPGAGVSSIPFPVDLPGPVTASDMVVVTTLAHDVPARGSRDLWFEVEFRLGRKEYSKAAPLLGGICYAGDPFLPYWITAQGENSANFGLPREIQVSWNGHQAATFLDGESAIVHQDQVAHSGVHVLATGPISVDRVTIRFADFPRLITDIADGESGATTLTESMGVFIPVLYFFEYEEDVRFRPRVPAGLLAATQSPPDGTNTYLAGLNADATGFDISVSGVAADYVFTTGDPDEFFPLSAASLVGEPREYGVHVHGLHPDDDRVETITEAFVSQAMEKGHQVRLFVSQTEEHRRCLSGVKLTFPDPKGVQYFTGGQAPVLDIKIYEIDPVEGVSPVDLGIDPATDKYASLLYHRRNVTPTSQPRLDSRFVRPSAARHFAIVLTSESEGIHYVGLTNIELIQSAHVTLLPRTSRFQQVRALNFRLIGPDLAADYAHLGPDSFNFAIERIEGGERKEILFEARSLLDLLQLSGVRLYNNQRYLETTTDVSRENSVTHAGSYEWRRTESLSDGWRRSRTGARTNWPKLDYRKLENTITNFRNESNAETRTRVEHLGFEDQSAQAVLSSAIDGIRSVVETFEDTPTREALLNLLAFLNLDDGNSLLQGSGWGENGRMWAGIDANRFGLVEGLLNVSVPPVLMPSDIVENLIGFLSDPLSLTPEAALEMIVGNAVFPLFALINGLGVGANVGGGFTLDIPPLPINLSGGISASTSQLLPTLTRTSTTGSNGTITASATRTGNSLSESRNEAYDDTKIYGEYTEDSPISRTITRELYRPGTVRERTAGVGVFWRRQAMDIVSGSVPLNLVLPATADKIYRTTDEGIRVRFGNGMRDGLRGKQLGGVVMDVWFDLQEEVLRDDY